MKPLLEKEQLDVIAPDRPCSGDLDTEVAFLKPLAQGALIVGVSGGATLGWELLTRSHESAGAILHEPAAGSLCPGLLDNARKALSEHGPAAFARTLYGPAWTPEEVDDDSRVPGDVSMFAGFEPHAPRPGNGPVQLTVGGLSPQPRHDVADAFFRKFRVPSVTLHGTGHAVHLERPELFTTVVTDVAKRTTLR